MGGVMKKISKILLLLVVTLLTLVGCGGNSTSEGNKIVYSMSVEPESLDPGTNIYARGSLVMQNLFNGLFKTDAKGETVPALAESLTSDEAGLIYTVKLKPNLKWSDGSPLTAKDFEYAWKRALKPELASRVAYEFFYIKNAEKYNKGEIGEESVGVKATDDMTLMIELENPTPYFKDLLASPTYFPVKKDVAEKEGWSKSAETYVSSGPFMVKELKTKEKYVLVKNPNYYDAANVKLDTIEIVFIESPETELGAFMNKEIDVAENLNVDAKTKYKGTPELISSPRIGFYYFDMNTAKAPMNDAKVRKALAMAIDRNLIITKILNGSNKPALAFVPNGIPYGTDGTKDYRDVVGDMYKEDKDEARKLLAEAGFPEGQGFPTLRFITSTSQTNKDIAQAMQEMWKKELNIQSEIVTFESKVYWGEMHSGNFDIGYDGWGGGYRDPMTMLEIFRSENNVKNNRWVNAEFDRLLGENKTLNDQAKRMENFAAAERLLAEDMPIMPLYYYEGLYLVNPRVKGIYKNAFGHTIFANAEIVK